MSVPMCDKYVAGRPSRQTKDNARVWGRLSQPAGPRRPVAAIVVSLMIAIMLTSAYADTSVPTKADQFRRSHQAGIRLGVWSNTGDLPVPLDTSGSVQYRASVNSASFYAEAYLGIRIFPQAIVEIAAGIVNRGEVTVRSNGYDYYGNISLYPVNLRLKLYPIGGLRTQFQPYVTAGGGLHVGKNNIQFSSDYYAAYNERSVTDFNLVLGGGVDWPISL